MTTNIKDVLISIVEIKKKIPRLHSEIGKLCQTINLGIPVLQKYVIDTALEAGAETPTSEEAGTKLVRVIALARDAAYNIVESFIRDHAKYAKYYPMLTEHPASPLGALFTVASALMAIVDGITIEYDEFDEQPQVAVVNWKCDLPAARFDYIVNSALCIPQSVNKPISTYSVEYMDRATQLLVWRWHNLDWKHEQLTTYIRALIHRSMLIVARVGTANIHNVDTRREKQGENFKASTDLIRQYTGALPKMLSSIVWWNSLPIKTHPVRADHIVSLRKEIRARIDVMKGITTIRNDMDEMYNRSSITYGDSEAFVEQKNMARQNPRTVSLCIHDSMKKMVEHIMQYNINIIKLVSIDEENAETYNRDFTNTDKMYMRNMKIYIAELILSVDLRSTVNFVSDFCVEEQASIQHRDELLEEKNPVLLSIMGKYHVLFNNSLYECRSTEEAILIWSDLVRIHLHGKLNNESVIRSLDSLIQINNTSIAQKSWTSVISNPSIVNNCVVDDC